MDKYFIQVGFYKKVVYANTPGEAFEKVHDFYIEHYHQVLEGKGKIISINDIKVEDR